MSHLSDKDIDHLAREAAEQLDVDQNSSGWEALQSKLDEEMPVQKRRRRWLFLLLLPLLGGGFFLAYKFIKAPDQNSITKQSITTNDNSIKQKQAAEGQIKEGNNEDADINGSANPNTQSPINESDGTQSGSGEPIILPGTGSQQEESNTIPGSNGSLKAKTPVTFDKASSTTATKNPRAADKGTIVKTITGTALISESASSPTANNSTSTVPKNEQPISNDPSNSSIGTDSSNLTTTPTVTSPDSTLNISKPLVNDSSAVQTASSKNPKKKPAGTLMPYKGFVTGLIAGPDVSKVNGTSTDDRGFNTGLILGYRFNGRLSLISGLNYTHKYYTALGSDYKPAKGTWLDTVSLSRVIGDCFMFEVPVNLRYDFIASKKNYAFVSAGLSSYFMQKENYDFHYTTNSGSYNSRYRSYEVSEQYWLSVLNLSAGYERMLTKRLSLQVEPYIKLPLSGIGFGNMDLSSYGVFLGVRYHSGTVKSR